MSHTSGQQFVDMVALVTANLFNLIMVAVFLLRVLQPGHPALAGVIWVILIIALAVIVFYNIKEKRGVWFVLMPLLLGIFLIIEVILDYVLKIDFRNTGLLAPYLILYYASIFGMIGYSFLVEKRFGFITLVTYFLSQAAALYSYMKVGHG